MGLQFTGDISRKFNLYTLYRPPSSTKTVFYMELEQLFTELSLCVIPSCIVGDFNIKYDVETEKRPLLELLNSFNLVQDVSEATHSAGHTLDFVITHNDDNLVTAVQVVPLSISDHHVVRCIIDASRPPKTSTEILKRNYRSFDDSTTT